MHVLLYSWSTCSFCARARELLEQNGIPFEEQTVDGNRALVSRLTDLFGARHMPFILVDGEPLGGVQELEEGLRRGDLGDGP